MRSFAIASLACASFAVAQAPVRNASAVSALLERVLGTASAQQFDLSFVDTCAGVSSANGCFILSDAQNGMIAVAATSNAELTLGLGEYLRHFCNLTFGWPRGGGSVVAVPSKWPVVGETVTRARSAKWSYIENVCTHSYSLVWYDWAAWQSYIDWMALSGINHALGMTGQEEVAYKVFTQFGLNDTDIRTWFNGPAFLTWSRGQNEYGNCIAGPLPRSWMKAQWALQRQILPRMRSLGMTAQLPAFQANVPAQLAAILTDSNMTIQGDTAWLNSADPAFGKIADAWMQTLCADFGCEAEGAVFQMDGYFDGGTAGWRTQGVGGVGSPGAIAAAKHQGRSTRPTPLPPSSPLLALAKQATVSGGMLPDCVFSPAVPNTYLAGCDGLNCASYGTLSAALAVCVSDDFCGGVTSQAGGAGPWEVRAGNSPLTSPTGEVSYYITNTAACRPPPPPISPDPVWRQRGAAAYEGVNRTVPGAIWSFQGWAIIDWDTWQQGSAFSGFVDSVPRDASGKPLLMVIDMSVDGTGEFQKWNNSAFFGAPFIWTTLHDFGGTDAMKGDLAHANAIPFGAPSNAAVVGSGYTPEGIDQNPGYYSVVMGAATRTEPIPDMAQHMVDWAHRRYQLTTPNPDVAAAWTLLVNSTYAQDLSVQDPTGIPHLPGSSSQFEGDRATPTDRLCLTWNAWGHLLAAAQSGAVDAVRLEPARYDLVNLGRELLAQLSTPMSQNFSDAVTAKAPLDAGRISATGAAYIDLLLDVDTLVGSDTAFLLGPWLQAARGWGAGADDCVAGDVDMDCPDFYEWNARSQLTTWNPTPAGAAKVPDGPVDYASKHWSGLIRDYYAARASALMQLGQAAAANGVAVNTTAADASRADIAYAFQHGYPSSYPTTPQGDPVGLSATMRAKYAPYYAACGSGAY